MTVLIPKIPHRLEELLGPQGRDEFVDFLNNALNANREDVVQVVGDRFERRLVEEISGVKGEIGLLRAEMKEGLGSQRAEMNELRGSLRAEMSELRGGLRADMNELRGSLRTEMKSDFAMLHRDMAVQTRWILVVLLAAGVLYPILNQVLARFFPG